MPAHNIGFEALGTRWHIEPPFQISEPLKEDIHAVIETVDQTWSRFRQDSLLRQMSHTAGAYSLSTPDRALLEWYRQLYDATDGKVSPLVGQTLTDAGYDSQYSLQPKETISEVPAWDDICVLTDDGITIKTPWQLDVGAAGKGYAVDRIAELFDARGYEEYVIDAGGDLRVHGRDETIGLEHPLDTQKVIGTFTMNHGSLCGSSSNRRAWKNWHHVIDPHTARPTTDVTATWVYTETAMIADGLATALFFVPAERLQDLARFDYIVVCSDGTVRHSASASLQMFTETPT